MLLNLRFQADSNPSLSASFSATYGSSNHTANQLSLRERKPNDFAVRLLHFRCARRAVHVHRCSDVRVPHEALLHQQEYRPRRAKSGAYAGTCAN
jgi:hypothetical protein